MANTTLDDARLDETFAALANSTRRAILARLAEGEASVNDLAAPFNLTLPAIPFQRGRCGRESKHTGSSPPIAAEH